MTAVLPETDFIAGSAATGYGHNEEGHTYVRATTSPSIAMLRNACFRLNIYTAILSHNMYTSAMLLRTKPRMANTVVAVTLCTARLWMVKVMKARLLVTGPGRSMYLGWMLNRKKVQLRLDVDTSRQDNIKLCAHIFRCRGDHPRRELLPPFEGDDAVLDRSSPRSDVW